MVLMETDHSPSRLPPPQPSITTAISHAIEWTRWSLFPFDFGRWLTLAVCGWLMLLGQDWGWSFSYGQGSGGGQGGGGGGAAGDNLREALEWVRDHIGMVALGLGVLLLLYVGLFLLFRWLNARGAFMFLDGIATRHSDIGGSWGEYSREGNSLFLAYALLLIAGTALGLLITFPPTIYLGGQILAGVSLEKAFIPTVLIMAAIGSLTAIPLILIRLSLLVIDDFLVPLMYSRRILIREAWTLFKPLLWANGGSFAIYLLARIGIAILLHIAMGIIFFIACVFSCCILALPVLWVLPVLPFVTFRRFFPILYLEQFGPEWAVLRR